MSTRWGPEGARFNRLGPHRSCARGPTRNRQLSVKPSTTRKVAGQETARYGIRAAETGGADLIEDYGLAYPLDLRALAAAFGAQVIIIQVSLPPDAGNFVAPPTVLPKWSPPVVDPAADPHEREQAPVASAIHTDARAPQ